MLDATPASNSACFFPIKHGDGPPFIVVFSIKHGDVPPFIEVFPIDFPSFFVCSEGLHVPTG